MTDNKDTLFNTIKSLEERLLDPSLKTANEEIINLLAEDFVEYSSSGIICNKQNAIDYLQSEQVIRFNIKDYIIRILSPDLILVNYIAIKCNDGSDNSSSLRSSIWRLNNVGWQIIFHQGTKITNKT